MAHAEARLGVAGELGEHHHVACRDVAARQLRERLGRHDHDVQLAFDGVAQGRGEHAGLAERRRQLVRAGV